MNLKIMAQAIGAFILILGIAGLLMGERQLANMINIDIVLDVTRITLGALLIGSTFYGDKAIKDTFAIFGAVYLGAFLLAMISLNMFGLLPHEIGPVDNLLLIAGGILGLGVAFIPDSVYKGRLGSSV